MNLFPMQVNPFNFSRGDAVKKIITDQIQSPYVGLVTAIIPATNKVEVQWPYGSGLEDPWDLLKVSPDVMPPIVTEDNAYKSFQNELSHKYYEKYDPKNLVNDYIESELFPLYIQASDLFNKRVSKEEAFQELSLSNITAKNILAEVVSKVYTEIVHLESKYDIDLDGIPAKINLSLNNDPKDTSFYILKIEITDESGPREDVYNFDDFQEAISEFRSFEEVINSLDNTEQFQEVIDKVAKQYFKKEVK